MFNPAQTKKHFGDRQRKSAEATGKAQKSAAFAPGYFPENRNIAPQ